MRFLFFTYICRMKEHLYFNPFRKEHVNLLTYLEKSLTDKELKIDMVKYGDRTQHIFVDNQYYLTVNWSLV